MTAVTVEHLILGLSLGLLDVVGLVLLAIGFRILRQMKAESDRTFRVLGALVVPESEKVQALLRE